MASNPFDRFDAMPDGDANPAGGSRPSTASRPAFAAVPTGAEETGRHGDANPFDQFDAAPITDTGTTMGFANEAPKEASKQLSAEDTAAFYKMLRGDEQPPPGGPGC